MSLYTSAKCGLHWMLNQFILIFWASLRLQNKDVCLISLWGSQGAGPCRILMICFIETVIIEQDRHYWTRQTYLHHKFVLTSATLSCIFSLNLSFVNFTIHSLWPGFRNKLLCNLHRGFFRSALSTIASSGPLFLQSMFSLHETQTGFTFSVSLVRSNQFLINGAQRGH